MIRLECMKKTNLIYFFIYSIYLNDQYILQKILKMRKTIYFLTFLHIFMNYLNVLVIFIPISAQNFKTDRLEFDKIYEIS